MGEEGQDDTTPTTPNLHTPLRNTADSKEKAELGLGAPGGRELDVPTFEKIKKWQNERLHKKLKGEYESAVLVLTELVNENLHTPLHISSIRIEGATRTSERFLRSIVNPFISPKYYPPLLSSLPSRPPPQTRDETQTLEDILRTTRELGDILQRTDIFKSVSARIERASSAAGNANVRDVDVVFTTKEKGRLFLKTSTEIGNNEGTASLSAHLRNTLGASDIIEANLTLGTGTTTKRAFASSFSFPLVHVSPDLRTRAVVEAYVTQRDLSSYASCVEDVAGVRGAVRRATANVSHELAYTTTLRNIGDLKPTASLSMRAEAGPSLKSSISHTSIYSTLNDTVMPTRGYFAKISQELAGGLLGGETSFYKAEVEGRVGRGIPFLNGSTLSLSTRCGFIHPLSPRRIPFSDRFQLGGPLSIRAFAPNGLGPREGPREGGDSLGGEVYWGVGVSLVSDLPRFGGKEMGARMREWPVKTHVWVNAGGLGCAPSDTPPPRTLASPTPTPTRTLPLPTLPKPSISAGVGLIYRFDPVRVEVNFGVPLVKSESDKSRRGVQVGMGLEFM